MLELLGAFVAGVLTTLAPCVLPLLPVIVGGSVVGVAGDGPDPVAASRGGATAVRARTRWLTDLRRPLVITASLGVSIVAFTLLLRASTSLIGIPPEIWSYLSGGILILLGPRCARRDDQRHRDRGQGDVKTRHRRAAPALSVTCRDHAIAPCLE